MANLEVNFCGVKFPNPLVLASGILGVTGGSFARTIAKGAGGITTKSIWKNPHPGHHNPTMFGNEHYFMNAVGLSDAGIQKALEELGEYIPKRKAPLIVNIVGGKKSDFADIAEALNDLPGKPDLLEVNISCPNVEDEFGKPFACSIIDAAEVTRLVKSKTKIPITVKLSPNVENISSIAKSVEDAGADAITAINTVGPGMRWNIDLRTPILANKVGGLSGPAIFPISVKCVYDIYKAVKIPIIATGGVCSGRDALEIMMAGGTLVGVGTAIYYDGDDFWNKATSEMSEWLKKEKIKNISEIIGLFHKK
ncbi:dihydroorotate dehydrogenase [Candidatus Gracilibacteria bacterium]|nr:dihydroorotate dehydrogenase [Candidatus Gracilibacteria bacterium]